MSTVVLAALLLAGIVVLTPVADRVKVPLPVLLTVYGLMLPVLPGMPVLSLEPDLILPLVLPPLLFAATQRATAREFRDQSPLDPAAGGRPHRRSAPGGRLGGLAAPAWWGAAWVSAPSWHHRTRWPPPRSRAACGSRTGWSPCSRARACSTTPPPWCSTARRSPPW